jgi:hypothetical protein
MYGSYTKAAEAFFAVTFIKMEFHFFRWVSDDGREILEKGF